MMLIEVIVFPIAAAIAQSFWLWASVLYIAFLLISLAAVCDAVMTIVVTPIVRVFVGRSVDTFEVWDKPEIFCGVGVRVVGYVLCVHAEVRPLDSHSWVFPSRKRRELLRHDPTVYIS